MLLFPSPSRQLALSLVAVLCACDSIQDLDRKGGDSERGYFNVDPAASIAVGAQLTLSIRDHETLGPGAENIGLMRLISEQPERVEVEVADLSGRVVVRGVSAGDARLSFAAHADGKLERDAYTLTAEPVTDLALDAPCGGEVTVLRGGDLSVAYRFNPHQKTPVLGLGLFPVAVDPEAGLDLDAPGSTLEHFLYHVPLQAPPHATLRATLAGSTASLAITTVSAAELDSVGAAALEEVTSSAPQQLDLRPSSQGRVVCGSFRRLVRSLTPDVCHFGIETSDVVPSLSTNDDEAKLLFVASGRCLVQLEIEGLPKPLAFEPITVSLPVGGGGAFGGGGGWD